MKRRKSNPFSLFSFQDIITGLCGIMIFFVLIMIVELAASRSASSPPEPEQTDDETKILLVQERIDELQDELSSLRNEMRELAILQEGAITETERYALKEKKKKVNRESHELKQEIDALKEQYAQDRRHYDVIRDTLRKLTEEKNRLKQEMEEKADMEALIGVTYLPEASSAKQPVFIVCDCEGIKAFQKRSESGVYTEKRFAFKTLLVDFRQFLRSELSPGRDSLIFLIRPSGIVPASRLVEIGRELNYSIGRDPLEEETKLSFGRR